MKVKVRYEVFGPFPFRIDRKTTFVQALGEFWGDRTKDGSPKDLPKAVGVYVWVYKKDKKWLPWNVGLTNKGFQKRFPNKERDVLSMLRDNPDVEVGLYLLALRNVKGKFRKSTISPSIGSNDWLETTLIGACISVNPDLRNKSKAAYLKTVMVDGYLNEEGVKRSKAAESFNALLKAQ